jgi:excisionase family DNA binding protein
MVNRADVFLEIVMTETSENFRKEGLSVAEACAIAGIGRTKIYEAIKEGSLRARKYGKRCIILRDDLRTFLTGLPIVVGGPK